MFSKAFLLTTPALAVPFFSNDQAQLPIQPLDHSQGYTFDPLLHLPGISPYFDAVGFGLEHTAPSGCNVTAASYIVRHGAIYANDDEYDEFIKPFLWKLEKHRDGEWLEELTPSGAVDAARVGEHLLGRYPDLIPQTQQLHHRVPQNDTIDIVRITTNVNGSMESLIPHKSCENFSKSPGTKEQDKFIELYGQSVAKRLEPFIPFKLTPFDVDGLQQLCGYESAINGKRSEICAVFTDAEWMAYEYSWDLKYAYTVGPMNPLSPYLGFPWLQTQSEIFQNIEEHNHPGDAWPADQRFFLSFTHHEVPPFVATALGLLNSSSEAAEEFPTDHINWTRAWRMADLILFLGHVGMKMMTCDRGAVSGDGPGEFIRFIANTAPRPIPDCQDGPGASCRFEDFQKLIGKGVEKHKDFHKVCDKKGGKGKGNHE
ncbi:histidine acid phosphatase-like protein [Lizonia empirigonia]|nr:histidine acid phosphatase-like protein [Lizonia empirigonia]